MSKVCSLLESVFGWAVRFASRVDTQGTINLFRIEDNCIWLDMRGRRKLYGFKLEGKDNSVIRLGKQFESILSAIRYIENADTALFFTNKDNKQSVYFYAFDERIIKQLCRDLRTKPMTGDELVSSVFEGLLAQRFELKDNRMVRSGFASEPFIPYGLEMASGKFRAKAEVAVDNIIRDYTIYQGVEYSSVDEFNPIDLFRIQWEGAIMMWFNFSAAAAESRIRLYESTAKFGDKVFFQECSKISGKTDDELLRLIKENSYIVNSIAILKDEGSKAAIEGAMKIVFEKNYLTGPKIAAKTLLNARDSDFDAILPVKAITKYFASSHKRETPLEFECDFSGLDISGNRIDYSFRNNQNPHCILSGKTGSGKSVQAIGILEGMIGFDYASKTAKNIDGINIRYCDVGYTSGKIMQDLRNAYPEHVEIFGSEVGGLRFGLFDFDLNDGLPLEEDLDFLVAFTSFALEIDGEVPLTGLEQAYYKKAVKEIFRTRKFTDLYVQELEKDGGYAKIIQSILEDGFSLKMKVSELPDKYDFLKKPIIQDVLALVDLTSQTSETKESEREVYNSLLLKLRVIDQNPMINKYSNIDFSSEKRIFHIDFDEIKENPKAFSISYWMIMKKWLKTMKKNAISRFGTDKKAEPTIFFIEEAHNFFRYKSFSEMLTTATKEIRKFQGRLFFITQDIKDIPEKIYQELSTKIIIGSKADLERYKQIARSVYPQADMSPIDEVIDKLEDRMLLIMSDNGVIGCQIQHSAPTMDYYSPLKIS